MARRSQFACRVMGVHRDGLVDWMDCCCTDSSMEFVSVMLGSIYGRVDECAVLPPVEVAPRPAMHTWH